MNDVIERRTDAAADDWTRHECYEGPLCETMTRYIDIMSGYADDPISREYGIYPERLDVSDCSHWTCLGLVHMNCRACYAEAMDEEAEMRHEMEEERKQRLHEEMIANDPDPFFGPM